MACSVVQLQFLDSFQFTMQSLDSLVSTMDNEDLKYTHAAFPLADQLYLMKKKGIFSYDFFDYISKITSNQTMTSRTSFFNKLADSEVKMQNYLHVKLVWETFGCQAFRDYHDLYLKVDVLLLTVYFEKFRNMYLDSYGIDAAHYYSAPGMAWDAALQMVKLQLFID